MWQQHLIGKLVQLLYYALHTITIFNVLLGILWQMLIYCMLHFYLSDTYSKQTKQYNSCCICTYKSPYKCYLLQGKNESEPPPFPKKKKEKILPIYLLDT